MNIIVKSYITNNVCDLIEKPDEMCLWTALLSRTSQGLTTVEDGSGDSQQPTAGRPGLRPKTATRTRDRMEVRPLMLPAMHSLVV